MVSDYRIPNQGMPISKTPGERGDLIVRTSVQYPQTSKIENMSESDKRIFEAVLWSTVCYSNLMFRKYNNNLVENSWCFTCRAMLYISYRGFKLKLLTIICIFYRDLDFILHKFRLFKLKLKSSSKYFHQKTSLDKHFVWPKLQYFIKFTKNNVFFTKSLMFGQISIFW